MLDQREEVTCDTENEMYDYFFRQRLKCFVIYFVALR